MNRYPNIEAERARLGLSKRELSQKLNITQKTLSNWQNGKSIASDKLDAMRSLFNCTADYLLSSESGVDDTRESA